MEEYYINCSSSYFLYTRNNLGKFILLQGFIFPVHIEIVFLTVPVVPLCPFSFVVSSCNFVPNMDFLLNFYAVCWYFCRLKCSFSLLVRCRFQTVAVFPNLSRQFSHFVNLFCRFCSSCSQLFLVVDLSGVVFYVVFWCTLLRKIVSAQYRKQVIKW